MNRVKIHKSNIEFTAANNLEIVIKIRELSFNKGKSIHDFMKQYARRAVILNDEDIRASSIDNFINDLIKLNHITLEYYSFSSN